MQCLTAFPATASDEEEGRFLSSEAFAAALRTRFAEKDWEKLSDPELLLESETWFRVPDEVRNAPLFSGLEEGTTRLPGFSGFHSGIRRRQAVSCGWSSLRRVPHLR